MLTPVQVPSPPGGLAEVSISPSTSSAMQKEADGHSMSSIACVAALSTAAQKDLVGHEIAKIW